MSIVWVQVLFKTIHIQVSLWSISLSVFCTAPIQRKHTRHSNGTKADRCKSCTRSTSGASIAIHIETSYVINSYRSEQKAKN